MTTKHTPTPWRVDPMAPKDVQGPDGELEILRANQVGDFGLFGIFPTEEACHANAAFIVRAVNSHMALVEIARVFVSGTASFERWERTTDDARALLAQLDADAAQ